MEFINDYRDESGVKRICNVLPIAPSTYHEQKAKQADPTRLPSRWVREEIERAWKEKSSVYRACKVWVQLNREGFSVARCTVQRLMRQMCLSCVMRGGKYKKTMIVDDAAQQPADLAKRYFTADRPNQLWVADITYVATWAGFAYVAFVTDVFSRRIVGWRVSKSVRSNLALGDQEQALPDRPSKDVLIRYSNRGVQYVLIRYTERLAEAGIEPSVGGVRDSYDNAMAETIFCSTARGRVLKRSSSQHSNGSTGSITEGCSSQSVISHRQSSRRCTTKGGKVQPQRLDSTK